MRIKKTKGQIQSYLTTILIFNNLRNTLIFNTLNFNLYIYTICIYFLRSYVKHLFKKITENVIFVHNNLENYSTDDFNESCFDRFIISSTSDRQNLKIVAYGYVPLIVATNIFENT